MGRAQPSAPFASRELNGEVLLDELVELRGAGVAQSELNELVLELRDGGAGAAPDLARSLRRLAEEHRPTQPSLSALLTTWAGKLKSDSDVPLLLGHFQRLAVTSALITATQRAASRLSRGGLG